MKYQVKDWQKYFENDRSRTRDKCSFVCVPNKQHGVGLAKILSLKDGAAVYGIWCLILGACSQQTNPREGWLTHNGQSAGEPWTPPDLALKFRRPQIEVERALSVLSGSEIGWLEDAHRLVTADSPSGHLERREGKEEKERKEEKGNGGLVSRLQTEISDWFRRKPSTRWSDKELRQLREIASAEPSRSDVELLRAYYKSDCKYLRRDILTLLNNWPGEIDRARQWKDNPRRFQDGKKDERSVLEQDIDKQLKQIEREVHNAA